ncbi:unnamed protein product, partial [Closterium sp. Naga37s-1]
MDLCAGRGKGGGGIERKNFVGFVWTDPLYPTFPSHYPTPSSPSLCIIISLPFSLSLPTTLPHSLPTPLALPPCTPPFLPSPSISLPSQVASFGAVLPSHNVVTTSFVPHDTHEAQVQFALERGVPAMLCIMATKPQPYPARTFDLAHCSRCLIPWSIE